MSGFVTLLKIVWELSNMMSIDFNKYHGTGNDFILVDNRNGDEFLNQEQIALLCHRRYGIGADGFMLLLSSDDYDFEMKYYNSDGKEGSMCGNGGRCISAFAFDMGIIKNTTTFKAIDGLHKAIIKSSKGNISFVEINLNEVQTIRMIADKKYILNTGSPHYVEFIEDLNAIDTMQEGKRIRWDKQFQPHGINVNFVKKHKSTLQVNTFERGVENITLSCGTGVTASAIAASAEMEDGNYSWDINTPGGDLSVSFVKKNSRFSNIWLKGPAEKVYAGTIMR